MEINNCHDCFCYFYFFIQYNDRLLLLKRRNRKNNQFQIKQIEAMIIHSIENIEKAYYFFEEDTERKMETITHYLIELYKGNPNFDLWDFTAVKEYFGVDIYILNEQNVITHSSFPDDIALNFTACCGKLAKILDERRNSEDLFQMEWILNKRRGK